MSSFTNAMFQDLKHYLATGQDANDFNASGFALLHIIVKQQYHNRQDLIITLMTHSNADIDVTTTKECRTALHLAVEVSL